MGDHFGNFWYDGGTQVQPTSDGGFLVAGTSATAKPVFEDLWLVKLSSTGVREWDRTLGGPLPDFANALIPARTGGFFLAGTTGGGNALGVRLAETGFASSDCGLSGPTAPNEWTSTLTVETAVSAQVPPSVTPLDSSAVRVSVPSTGAFLCAPN
jgi:hypothetical protein